MFCNQCGEENRNDRKFCSNCGSPLIDYTKPKENLVFPEDIKKEQQLQKANKTAKIFDIISVSLFLTSILLTAISLFVENQNAKLVLTIISLVLYVIILANIIAKIVILKKSNKKEVEEKKN
ncbi:MAG: zinc ribbon domain-containing protein [Clostridiales bacterium]|nr:zinc ribbon domain-containing protein [Clostridiales bacterium]